jgi:GDPmannose 4,6-dehydratase
MFACSGILFNHESERRGIEFVTRKISDGIAQISTGLSNKIILGNLDAKRDWGYSPDYVEAMWLMLQQDTSDDYVISTGETHSIREFLDVAFNYVGLPNWEQFVGQDERYMRPAEVDYLRGDSTKAREILDWKPKTSFKDLVEIMVENDIKKYRRQNG